MSLILKPRGSGTCHNIGVVKLYFFGYDCTKLSHFAFAHKLVSYKYVTVHTHTQNTTHTQQQNEPLPPYPPASSPSLAIATPIMTSNQDTSAPCGSVAGARRRVHACLNLFLCLGCQHISKNRAMGVDLAFLTRCQSWSKNIKCSYYSNI